MNYYELLGLKAGASEEEIKKAYRDKCKETHPDVNPNDPEAEKKFKAITEAYDVLTDPVKKSNYDRFGSSKGHNSRVNYGNTNPFESNVFDDIFGQYFYQGNPNPNPSGEHVSLQVKISLLDVLNGCDKTVKYLRKGRCGKCKGTGGTQTTCSVCHGKGGTIHRANSMIVQRTCPACNGAGRIVKDRCVDCLGTGLSVPAELNLTIKILPGIVSGMQIVAPSQGHAGKNNGPFGNLIVTVLIEEHPIFRVAEDGDLTAEVPVSYTQLIFGDEIEIPSVDGKKLSFKLPPNSPANSKFRLEGKGLPKYYLGKSAIIPSDIPYGSIIVKVYVDLPGSIDDDYKKVLKKLAKLEKENVSPKKREFSRYLD
jgi:molecular chaperone DnaJ